MHMLLNLHIYIYIYTYAILAHNESIHSVSKYKNTESKAIKGTHINILFSNMGGIMWIWAVGVHPLNGIVSTLRIERVVVVFDILLYPLVEEVLCYLVPVADESVVFDWRK